MVAVPAPHAALGARCGKAPPGADRPGNGRVEVAGDWNRLNLFSALAMTEKKTHNIAVPVERDAQSDDSSAGGGSIGAKETDVSKGHAASSRSDHGLTEPAPTPPTAIPKTEREFERAMRAIGFTKREARTITSHGFKGLAIADPANDATDLASLTERLSKLFDHIERPTS